MSLTMFYFIVGIAMNIFILFWFFVYLKERRQEREKDVLQDIQMILLTLMSCAMTGVSVWIIFK